MKKILTLAYLLTDTEICLALKKRGFGEGNWNGLGGKVEAGETIEGAAVREMHEEADVLVEEKDLEKMAIIEFFFADGKHLEVHTFFTRTWRGIARETEEMQPAWFPFAAIPFDRMWADDPHWLPRALRGEKLRGKVWFLGDGQGIERMEWEQVADLR